MSTSKVKRSRLSREPAVWAVEVVGQRRPELIHQMAVGLELEAVETGGLHPLGGIGDNP